MTAAVGDLTGAESFLRAHGAAAMPHPGGTLLDHLVRVQGQLAAWGADRDLRLAGFCHAAYGTAGFAPSLLAATERGELAAVIGERAENVVYLYGSCDRAALYPRLGGAQLPVFRDRFTGAESVPGDAELRAFMEITAANELDVLAHNPEIAARATPKLRELLARTEVLLSPAAREAYVRQLAA